MMHCILLQFVIVQWHCSANKKKQRLYNPKSRVKRDKERKSNEIIEAAAYKRSHKVWVEIKMAIKIHRMACIHTLANRMNANNHINTYFKYYDCKRVMLLLFFLFCFVCFWGHRMLERGWCLFVCRWMASHVIHSQRVRQSDASATNMA